MSTANVIVDIAALCGGIGGLGAGVDAIRNYRRRRDAARDEDHDSWFEEAKDAYSRAKQECADCLTKLQATEKKHSDEMGKIRRDFSEVKEALIGSMDDVDALLPYVQGLPDEKMREIRAGNRAKRNAAKYWGQP